MRQDVRDPFAVALEAARQAAYPPGEYVGQESFMLAGEIRELAARAAITPGASVLDLCCGVAGPGRMITAELGCRYLGVDSSASALRIAAERAADLPCRFLLADIPPVPDGRFDVVLLLETLLAFPDKQELLAEVAQTLAPGGRFACTVEEGRPLDTAERAAMPDAGTVWPVELPALTEMLRAAGLTVTWQQDCSASHHTTATALLRAYRDDEGAIARRVGTCATEDLITAHQWWVEWLGSRRVRKFAIVAEKPPERS